FLLCGEWVAPLSYELGRRHRPENPACPPHEVLPPKLSLATHRPAPVPSRSSAPRPRDLLYRPAVPLELVISAPVDGSKPPMPGAGSAPAPWWLQPLVLPAQRSWPPM